MDAETALVSYAEKLSYPNYVDQPQHIKNLIARAFRLHQQEITKARIEEARGYCDDGHYHDYKRDTAMLPSERLTELRYSLKDIE